MNKVKIYYSDPLAYFNLAHSLKDYIDNAIIVCIGTDKCIGDCLGPLIGTILKDKNFPLPVFGDLKNPIHALNINIEVPKIQKKFQNKTIIAIDACLGSSSAIGEIHLRHDPLKPGKGVGKVLPSIGDLSIIGIVDESNKYEAFSNKSIRLSLIMDMANTISNSLLTAYSLNNIIK
ncbi:spore protease YyaC [uncultured Clostridium sp.]|uniref:spore protease YyaC n=1 Tax=uncultured Clostridium sp. TaxID=59620 RepID=UPI0026028745|nr:spore protease YyaC [uncultured Clostridium sp.]